MLKIIILLMVLILLVGCQATDVSVDNKNFEESSEEIEISDILNDLEEIDSLDDDLGEDIYLDELDNLNLE